MQNQKKYQLKLFPKLALILVVLSTLPLAVVGFNILSINKISLETEVLRHHKARAEALADKIRDRLSNIDGHLRIAVSGLYSASTYDTQKIFLQAVMDASPHFAIISLVNNLGLESLKVYNPDLEPNLAEKAERGDPSAIGHHTYLPLYEKFQRKKTQVYELSYKGTDPRIELYYPLAAEGGNSFSIYMSVSLLDLWNKVASTTWDNTGLAYLVDSEGIILSHPDSRKVRDRISAKGISLVDAALLGQTAAQKYEDSLNRKLVGAATPVGSGLSIAIITQQDQAEAFAASRRGKKRAIFLIILSAFAAAGVAYWAAQRASKPILTIIKAAQSVDLDRGYYPEPVEVNTGDELQELADTFNIMTEKLKIYAAFQVERLLAEKTKTEAIIFSIADGIIMTDYKGNVQLFNNKAREILNVHDDPESILGKALTGFLPSDQIRKTFKQISKAPESDLRLEFDMSTENTDRNFQITAEPVRSRGQGEELGVVTVIHDITLEKQLDNMKDEFLHTITHDLRNPMTSIRGFLKFLKDGVGGPITEQQFKMLDTMDRASSRLLGMINDILNLAKLEAGKMELSLSECQINEIASRVLELQEPTAKRKSVRLILESDPQLGKIMGDSSLIERVFTNIVSNSIKFTPENGSVTVKIKDTPGAIVSSIVDTGEGIPSDYVDRIFDKFQQVAGQRKGGTGLGLTICKYIVEAHKGNIRVTSKLSHGSTFTFSIPKGLAKTEKGEIVCQTMAA